MRLAAPAPPEELGVSRDEVRLLAASPGGLSHSRFADLPRFLSPGDLLVVNTSATVPAAVDGQRAGGRPVAVHVSGQLDDGSWLVELRPPDARPGRVADATAGERIALPAGVTLTLLRRYPDSGGTRMWAASAAAEGGLLAFLGRHGRPIRYSYTSRAWPLAAYQTVFARVPGSAEMPSAARPFTPGLVTGLVAAGVVIAPVTLHAGVASLEAGEPPLPERFTVPETTAQLVNLTRAARRRVVAVGTSATRALESAAAPDGTVRAAGGWTGLVLGPERPARVVSGLITGWHDEDASHLALLVAVAGADLVRAAYREAESAGYLWHEFGDSCLLLPDRPAGPGQPGQTGSAAMVDPRGDSLSGRREAQHAGPGRSSGKPGREAADHQGRDRGSRDGRGGGGRDHRLPAPAHHGQPAADHGQLPDGLAAR